jgi:hypothetical protein
LLGAGITRGDDPTREDIVETAMRLIIAAVAPLAVAGCLSFGGGSDTSTTVNPPTTGQQLLDLKKAYDSGAISKEEYEAVRESILKGQR